MAHGIASGARAAAGRLLGWVIVLVAGLALLSMLGGDVASPPLLRGVDATSAWAHQRDAAMIVIAALRMVAIVLGWYLLGSTLVALVAHASRVAPFTRIADALVVPGVRRLVQATLGATLAGGAFVVAATGPAPSPMLMRRTAGGGDVTMVRTDPATTTTITTTQTPTTTTPTTAVVPAAQADVSTRPPSGDARAAWTVRPGDHLWRIAEEVLTANLGRRPSDRETDPYWRRLVAANRGMLADPDNPDLIFPGQVFVVPPV